MCEKFPWNEWVNDLSFVSNYPLILIYLQRQNRKFSVRYIKGGRSISIPIEDDWNMKMRTVDKVPKSFFSSSNSGNKETYTANGYKEVVDQINKN